MFLEQRSAQVGDHRRTLFYMARRLFFVDEVRGGRAEIGGDEAHHLTRVLRVEPGQKFEIAHEGRLYLAEVEAARKNEVSFAILETLPVRRTLPHVELFAALIRFEQFEWIVEKATELGVAAIVPVLAERSEKGLEAAARKRSERWRRIAREASEQSRRAALPELGDPLQGVPASPPCFTHRYVCDELSGTAPLVSALPPVRTEDDRIALLIGPEGGWTDRERAAFEPGEWTPVSLGTGVLRAETAAIAAVAIVNAWWHPVGGVDVLP